MKLSFHGAASEVTGSCHLLQTKSLNILIDCGMFQGENSEQRNFEDFKFDPKELDYVILTHAHVDHCGRLPLLLSRGFRGRIIATEPTIQLAELMLVDAAKIQEYDVKRGRIEKPLYTVDEAVAVLDRFQSLGYHKERVLAEDVKFQFYDAGHILGSCLVKFNIIEDDAEKTIVFSGDIGHPGQKIVRDPELINEADFVVIESTYGDRVHLPRETSLEMLVEELRRGYKNNSDVIIPSFAVERAQELLYDLNKYYEKGEFGDYPVYFDTPLGVSATKVYSGFELYYDEEALKLVRSGDDPYQFPNLKVLTNKKTQGGELIRKPGIIIAGSGMCSGGKVVGHIKKNISDPNASILFIGYQAEGTLGRQIQENKGTVKIEEQEYIVRAKIVTISGFSAHGDQNDLVHWINNFDKNRLKKVFVIHGEETVSANFKELISKDLFSEILIPKPHEEFNI